MNTRILPSLVLVTAFLLPACRSKSNVLATVNGHNVTQAEFDAYLHVKHLPANDEKRRDRALQDYLERLALASAIEKEPNFDRAAIEAEIAEVRKETEISRYFDRFLDEKVNDVAIKNYYDAHAAEYEQRKVHVAHILVRTNPKMSPEERAAKQTAAQELYSKLKGSESFEDVARVSSEDRISGAKGGDLGWLREGSIDPEFSKRAFAAQVGTVSEPFPTQFGFHILKVLEEPKVIRKPYNAVLGDIRYQLRAEAKEAELKRLKAKGSIAKKDPYKFDAAAAASGQPVTKAPIAAQEFPRDPAASEAEPGTLGLTAPTVPVGLGVAPIASGIAGNAAPVPSGVTKRPVSVTTVAPPQPNH